MLFELTIDKVIPLTDHCSEFQLRVPEELKGTFSYLPGQHLTFEETIHGEKVRRNYSICSGPHDETLNIAVKSPSRPFYLVCLHALASRTESKNLEANGAICNAGKSG